MADSNVTHPMRSSGTVKSQENWLRISPGQRARFVAWLHMNGLTEALQDARYLGREDNEVGCLDYYTVPPASDPYRPTTPID
jgi:hypothetical protein